MRGAQAERLAGGRAGGWTPGKMPRRRARRRGFRGPAGRGAGQRAAAVRGGRGAAVHTWSAAGTEGPAARGGRGQRYGAISGRDQGSERWGGGEEAGRGAGRREWRRLRLGRSLCAGAGGGRAGGGVRSLSAQSRLEAGLRMRDWRAGVPEEMRGGWGGGEGEERSGKGEGEEGARARWRGEARRGGQASRAAPWPLALF